MKELQFTPEPTCRRFMESEAPFRFLVGAIGSAKTTTSIYEILRRASEQEPAPDGVRYTRFAIVRNTLQAIKNTVLKDMQLIFKDIIDYRVSESTVYIRQGDINCEILLIPLEHEEDQKRLLSSQLTGVFFNEFIEIKPEFITKGYSRCGRYPSQHLGNPTWKGVFCDSNPGTEDSPWFEKLKIALPDKWEYFEQPVPMWQEEDGTIIENPDAENIYHLGILMGSGKDPTVTGYDYYYNSLAGADPAWAERYVFGQWGESLSGEAVFKSTFNPKFHVSEGPLTPSQGYPLIIGMDFARHPAAIIQQVNHTGTMLVLKETYKANCGVEKFIREHLMPVLYSDRFAGLTAYISGDPSGIAKSQIGEESVFHMLERLGFVAVPAFSNHIDPRLRSVDSWLLQQRGGGPGIIYDPEGCDMLIRAMKGKYRYKKKRDGELEPKPDKVRPWADLADAHQYGCMGANKNVMGRVMHRLRAKDRKPAKPLPVGAWT